MNNVEIYCETEDGYDYWVAKVDGITLDEEGFSSRSDAESAVELFINDPLVYLQTYNVSMTLDSGTDAKYRLTINDMQNTQNFRRFRMYLADKLFSDVSIDNRNRIYDFCSYVLNTAEGSNTLCTLYGGNQESWGECVEMLKSKGILEWRKSKW